MEGRLAHQDSLGEPREIGPNEVQAMSAGSGVIHSEFNASATEPTHFLQIWIVPSREDIDPSYQQFAYAPVEKHNVLRLMAGPDTNNVAAAHIHQDAQMYAAVLDRDNAITYTIPRGRHVWLHCAAGHMDVNGMPLEEGDGVAVSDESALELRGTGADGAEFVLFDLA
jgi:redox-sensitive bicupin YhaK (pirin superfamily)